MTNGEANSPTRTDMTTPSDASQAVELPPLNAAIQRLRDSIAWLRDGEPHKLGIGVADMVIIEAALRNREALWEALNDMHSGWLYIRSTHGDLYGVGWERAQEKAEAALEAYMPAIAQDRAARAQAEPKLPEGWVPCLITYEGDEPEEVAFGPQRMMDRLKKWLTSYFEHIYAERYPAARAQGAGEEVAIWQFRWTNPGNYSHQSDDALAWKEVVPNTFQTMEDRVSELRGYKSDGKHCYEVRPLYTAPTIPQAAEVPGFVLVPREPTEAMLPEAWRIANGKVGLGVDHECLRAIYRSMIAATPTPTASAPKAEGEAHPNLTERLQQKCSDWNTYWRAPDAHGVILSPAQAVELLQDALGVEVEITQPPSKADRTREGGDVDSEGAKS